MASGHLRLHERPRAQLQHEHRPHLGQLKAKWDKAGISVPSLDSQIAATAHRHSLTVVTRNISDFEKAGVMVVNPF